MKIKTLPPTFHRRGFEWELIHRKRVLHLDKEGRPLSVKKWGIYQQDPTHWVVCRILDSDPSPYGKNPEEWDKIETIAPDRTWGLWGFVYDTLEEAQREYDLK